MKYAQLLPNQVQSLLYFLEGCGSRHNKDR
jgi:hypothetical protein